MSKRVDIEYCGDCPNSYFISNDRVCNKTNKVIGEEDIRCPEWCPLPPPIERVMTVEDWNLGTWLSAALDCDNTCEEMKKDIIAWLGSFRWEKIDNE